MCSGVEIALIVAAAASATTGVVAATKTPPKPDDLPIINEVASEGDAPTASLVSTEAAQDAAAREKGRKNRLRVGLESPTTPQVGGVSSGGVGTGLKVG